MWVLPCQQALKKIIGLSALLRGVSRSRMVRDVLVGGGRAVKACGYRVQICANFTRVQGGVAARVALGVVGAGCGYEPRKGECEDAEEELGTHHAE